MGKPANFEIDYKLSNSNFLVIRDIGPWEVHFTVTNDAENVVERLKNVLEGRRLLWFDSADELDELLIKNGRFAGFAPCPPYWEEE